MSTDFVVNFLQAIDGEKDPRNLLLLFQIIPKVIDSFDLGPFIEDFYEVLACYFPIDFTPVSTYKLYRVIFPDLKSVVVFHMPRVEPCASRINVQHLWSYMM